MRAKRRINNSVGAFRSVASSTIFSIRVSALSPCVRVTRRLAARSKAIMPAKTSPSMPTCRGMLSPVSAAVSKLTRASRSPSGRSSTPSSGTRSPGSTSITSPTLTISGLTSICSMAFFSPFHRIRRASSGR